jgi:DNA-binding Lrp family transcriptional regulator
LKFHNFNQEIETKLIEFLRNRKGMHWVAGLNGCYDFCIILLNKNIKELNDVYSEIIYKFSNFILDKELSIATKKYYYPLRYIFGPVKSFEKNNLDTHRDFKPDNMDFKIINLIKQDSRMPLLDISEKLKLSPQTIRSRMKILIKNDIISGFRIRIESKMLGLHHFHTFLSLSKINSDKEKEIINFLASLNSTIHIIKGTGKYDIEFESLLKSSFELYDIINQIKNKFPDNIQHSDSALIYKIYNINTVRYSA